MTDAVMLHRPGLVEYEKALRWQNERAEGVRARALPEAMAILEHPPVYTLGMRGALQHLLLSSEAVERRGATVVQVDRGGDITYHGPGQLVAYPILNVARRGLAPASYVRRLEAVVIETLESFGIEGARIPGRPGVWVRAEKVAALGVRVRGGVTTHGLALNVSTDLAWFDGIVPCGISDASVTSMERQLGAAPPHAEVEEALARAFEHVFDARLITSETELSGVR